MLCPSLWYYVVFWYVYVYGMSALLTGVNCIYFKEWSLCALDDCSLYSMSNGYILRIMINHVSENCRLYSMAKCVICRIIVSLRVGWLSSCFIYRMNVAKKDWRSFSEKWECLAGWYCFSWKFCEEKSFVRERRSVGGYILLKL
jgi:hypothetical protein